MTFEEALDRWPDQMVISLLEDFLVENDLIDRAEEYLSERAADEEHSDMSLTEGASG